MKRQIKKMMSAVLGVCMMISAVPLGVHAAAGQERHWSYNFNGVTGNNFGNQGFSFKVSDYSTNNGVTQTKSTGWNPYGRLNADESLMIRTSVPATIPTANNWGVSAIASGSFWETFVGRGCEDAKYLHVGFDFALSEKKNVQEDAYLEVKINVNDGNGNGHEGHAFGFGTGNRLVLWGQRIDYAYEPETWLRADYVFDTVNSTVDVYINGTKMVNGKSLGFDMNGAGRGFNAIKFNVLDSKTAQTEGNRTFDIYIDDFGFDYTINPYHVKDYKELSAASGRELVLEHSKYGNLIDNANGLVYTTQGLTVKQLIEGLNGVDNKDDYYSVVRMSKPAGDYNGSEQLTDDALVETSNTDKDNVKYDTMRKLYIKAKVVQEAKAVMGRIYYIPIEDAAVISIKSDDVDTDGYYTPDEPMDVKVANSASGASVKVLFAQYTEDGRLTDCVIKNIITSVENPSVISYTPTANGDMVKIYLWNDNMQSFKEAQVLTQVP